MVLHLKVWESRSSPDLVSRSVVSLKRSIKLPVAGWSSPVARQAHNLKVVGSNPTPATNLAEQASFGRPCLFSSYLSAMQKFKLFVAFVHNCDHQKPAFVQMNDLRRQVAANIDQLGALVLRK